VRGACGIRFRLATISYRLERMQERAASAQQFTTDAHGSPPSSHDSCA
jgi:hypothetical protein